MTSFIIFIVTVVLALLGIELHNKGYRKTSVVYLLVLIFFVIFAIPDSMKARQITDLFEVSENKG